MRRSACAGFGLDSEIVSGDDDAAVARIAARSGIERHESRLSPEAKLARLKTLQSAGAVVVAVGDGINDAPLLRGADVAIAMGRGSALAQTSADLILVRDSLDAAAGNGASSRDARSASCARTSPGRSSTTSRRCRSRHSASCRRGSRRSACR